MKYLSLIAPSSPTPGLPMVSPIENPALEKIKTKTGIVFFQDLIPTLVTLGFIIGSLVFFFFLITGAITWIVSGGDKTKLESAKNKISNAIIGFVILLLAFAIVALLESFFHINITLLDIETIKIR